MASKFLVSGFSDEIDKLMVNQFTHFNKLGISYFEPRFVDGKSIADLSDDEVMELKKLMDEYDIKVSSIGSPIGKISITDDFESHLKKLSRVIDIAKMLEAKYIRIFSFFIPKDENHADYRDEVMNRLEQMVKLAEEKGVILLHENEKGIYGDVAKRCFDIFETIKSPALGCVFDPANFIQCGQAVYPEAFEMLSPYITYMHIKDAKPDGTVVPAGYGIGGLRDIIKELSDRNFEGFLSLEPHLGSFAGLADLELTDDMLKLEESGPDKFTMAHSALLSILEEVK